ncbi:MAG TPA: septal ring lytic transglycosylase RlpA family protein [Trichocoleus sp.]
MVAASSYAPFLSLPSLSPLQPHEGVLGFAAVDDALVDWNSPIKPTGTDNVSSFELAMAAPTAEPVEKNKAASSEPMEKVSQDSPDEDGTLAWETVGSLAAPMGLLPSGTPEADPRYSALNPQLPVISENALDWSLWNSVANVSVIKVGAGETGAEIAFLNTGGQCMAFTTSLERETAVSAAAEQKSRYQIWVHDTPVGEVKTAEAAYRIATKLRRLLQLDDLQPARLKPLLGDSFAAGGHDSEILFVVDQAMLLDRGAHPALVASQWINNLRVAFGEDPLGLVDLQMIAYGLRETGQRLQGTASWYGPYFHGRKTATGEIFNQHELTAAHPSLPFGTYLKVRNQLNGRSIIVRVNDRGPYVGERSLDLSYAAAQCLGSEQVGVIPYEATILKPGIPARWNSALVAGLRP